MKDKNTLFLIATKKMVKKQNRKQRKDIYRGIRQNSKVKKG